VRGLSFSRILAFRASTPYKICQTGRGILAGLSECGPGQPAGRIMKRTIWLEIIHCWDVDSVVSGIPSRLFLATNHTYIANPLVCALFRSSTSPLLVLPSIPLQFAIRTSHLWCLNIPFIYNHRSSPDTH
jgi:hypothetical protein